MERDIKEIIRLYTEDGISKKFIANLYGVSCITITRDLKKEGVINRKRRLQITKTQEDNICTLYTLGNSTEYIANLYKTTNSTIGRILRSNNIELRNGNQHLKKKEDMLAAYKSGNAVAEIARNFDVNRKTVDRLLSNEIENYFHNVGVEYQDIEKFKKTIHSTDDVSIKKGDIIVGKKYIFYEDYFSKIETRDKAYITGLLHSDGYLAGKNQVRIKLTDQELIQEVSKRFYINTRPLLSYEPDKSTHKRAYTFIVTSDKIYNDCIKHGCVHNKTYNLQFPTTIEDQLLGDYMRGFFDGDGCIHTRTTLQYQPSSVRIVATKDWITGAIKWVKSKGIKAVMYEDNRYDNRIGIFCISNVPDIIKFYYLIYNNIENQIVLDRKYSKYKQYIKFKLETTYNDFI